MTKSLTKNSLMIVCCSLLALSISGCREAEQNRILSYEKGVYLGKLDTALTPEEHQKLIHNTARQAAW